MTLKTALSVCIKVLSSKEREDPGGAFDTPHGEIPYKYAIKELKRVREWVYPELRTEDIQIVTHCRNCQHYKRLRKKNSIKPVYKTVCIKDRREREPDFFCADGNRGE